MYSAPPNIKIDIANLKVELLEDDLSKIKKFGWNAPDAVSYYSLYSSQYSMLHGNLFDIVLGYSDSHPDTDSPTSFARIERPDWPRKQDGNATARIYQYHPEQGSYQIHRTLQIPYTSLPFKYELSGDRFLVIGDGDDPRAISFYNLSTGESKYYALDDILSKEMIAGRQWQEGNAIYVRYYGSRFPKVRTRYVSGSFHSRHQWLGDGLNFKGPNVEIDLDKMTVTLLGYDEEESEK